MRSLLNSIIFSLLILAAGCGSTPVAKPDMTSSRRLPAKIIKVSIVENALTVTVSSDSGIKAANLATGQKASFEANKTIVARPLTKSVTLNNEQFGREVSLTSSSGIIEVNGRNYRDAILIRNNKGKLTVINKLSVEEYLYGVIAREIIVNWPMEVLKAQAVASRTYLLANLGKYAESGYDVSSDVYSQVYGGMDSENPRTTQAVDETRNEVIVWHGEIAKVYFHACCGGHTDNTSDVWDGENEPYLDGVRCPYCYDSPHWKWNVTISRNELERALGKGFGFTTLSDIQIDKRSNTGRIKTLILSTDIGEICVQAHRFRLLLGVNRIKSTMFSVTRRGSYFKFTGKGWGHGVGFCQWGGYGMAKRGADYRKIIGHYFPGVEIERWSN